MQVIKERAPFFSAKYSVERKGQDPIHCTYEGPVPEEVMDSYKQIIGDGQARVSATCDVGIKDFGTGVSATVTISLACDQSNEGITMASQWAGNLALHFAKEQRARADVELRQLLAAHHPYAK